MKKLTIVILSVMLIMAAGPAAADSFSARTLGMGGAFTGIADDVSAVLYNPAGINQSGVLGIKAFTGFSTDDFGSIKTMSDKIDNFSQNSLSSKDFYDKLPGVELGGNSNVFIGANLKSLALSVDVNSNFNLIKNEDDEKASFYNYTTAEGGLTLGNTLLDPPLNIGTISYGANLKMVNIMEEKHDIDLSTSDPQQLVIKKNGQTFGLDVGVLAQVTDIVTVGAQIDNLWADDYELDVTEKKYTTYDQDQGWGGLNDEDTYTEEANNQKRTMRVGASIQIPVIGATLAADIDNFPLMSEGDREMVYHYGIEKNLFFNALSLRAGSYTQGQDKDDFYTVGLGVNLLTAHVDLAIGSDDRFKESITGVLSGSIKF